MGNNLRILLLIFSILWFIFIFVFLKKGRIPVKYSLFWFLSALIVLFIAVFPNFLSYITSLMGFQTISNMIVGVILSLLLILTFMLTMIVSKQKKQITILIQEVSILKNKMGDFDE